MTTPRSGRVSVRPAFAPFPVSMASVFHSGRRLTAVLDDSCFRSTHHGPPIRTVPTWGGVFLPGPAPPGPCSVPAPDGAGPAARARERWSPG